MDDKLFCKYSFFADLMVTGRIYLDPDVDFTSVCRCLEVPVADMDALLLGELGMTGDELFSTCRRIAVDAVSNLY